MAIYFSQLGILDNLPSRLKLETGDITVIDLLRFLERKYNYPMDNGVIVEGKLNSQLLILVNGVSITQTEGLNTIIPDEAKVLLMGMVSEDEIKFLLLENTIMKGIVGKILFVNLTTGKLVLKLSRMIFTGNI